MLQFFKYKVVATYGNERVVKKVMTTPFKILTTIYAIFVISLFIFMLTTL